MNCESKKKKIVITKEQKEAIERVVSSGERVELMSSKDGLRIIHVKRTDINLNT